MLESAHIVERPVEGERVADEAKGEEEEDLSLPEGELQRAQRQQPPQRQALEVAAVGSIEEVPPPPRGGGAKVGAAPAPAAEQAAEEVGEQAGGAEPAKGLLAHTADCRVEISAVRVLEPAEKALGVHKLERAAAAARLYERSVWVSDVAADAALGLLFHVSHQFGPGW